MASTDSETNPKFRISPDLEPGVVELFSTPFSQPCRAVLWLLLENQIPYKFTFANLADGFHLTEDFGTLNPNRTAPVIRYKDPATSEMVVFWDSHAILTWLLEKFPQVSITTPPTPEQRATVHQFLAWKESVLRRALATYASHVMNKLQLVPTKNIRMTQTLTQNPADALRDTHRAFAMLEKFLSKSFTETGSVFIGGVPQCSIADISICCEISQCLSMNVTLHEYPSVLRWLRVMEQRPHYLKVHAFFKRFGFKTLFVSEMRPKL